jgi:predicted alpha/beta superfamily hydrolase
MLLILIAVPLSCCIDEGPTVVEMTYEEIEPAYDIVEVGSMYVSDTFRVYVMVPEGLDKARPYDMVYLLDGDWYFDDTYRIDGHGVSGIICNLGEQGVIGPTVLVGIGYPVGNQRGRDFSQRPYDFYRFIKYELSSFLDDAYGLDTPRSSTLVGHSSAGFFTFHVLFTGEHHFDNYVAVSTPFYEVNKVLLSDELSFYNRFKDASMGYRLFMAVGGAETERFTASHDDMAARLRVKDYEGIAIDNRVYPGKDHMTVVFDAFLDGLAWVLSDVDDVVLTG